MPNEELTAARIVAIHYEATDVLSFVLRPADGSAFPKVDPGAHIDIRLRNGLERSYSLSNGTRSDEGSYRLTVARDRASRGGSVFMHEQLCAGEIVQISAPRNNFRLDQDAPLSVFIAGGIGITPFVPMIAALNAAARPWRLHFCARTPDRAPLLSELTELAGAGPGELIPNFDEQPGGAMLDLDRVLRDLPQGAHAYCCGPTGMLSTFRASAAAAGIADERIHFEYFSSDIEPALEGGYTVVLERTGREVYVEPGETILDVVTGIGVDVPYSCQEGVCGSCETRVLQGIPDHRDLILSPKERQENKTMMICCSGSKSARLVLDL